MALIGHSMEPSKTRTTAREGSAQALLGLLFSSRLSVFPREDRDTREELPAKPIVSHAACPPCPSCLLLSSTHTVLGALHTSHAAQARPVQTQHRTSSGPNWDHAHGPSGPHFWGQSGLPSPRLGPSHHTEHPRLHSNLRGRNSLSRALARFVLPSPAHTGQQGRLFRSF